LKTWGKSDEIGDSLLPLGAFLVLIGSVLGLIGVYWDDAWHTDFGRDTFWSPPHLALYAGVMLFGIGVAFWMLLTFLQTGSLGATLRQTPLLVALLGAIVTPISAPIDEFWHTAFGRDAVLWSPPHIMGMVGFFALASGALLWVRHLPGQLGRSLTTFSTTALLASLLTLVFEYESDVPQFAVFWYLPVLTGAASLAFTLGTMVSAERWLATKAATLYTVMMIGVIVFLMVLGHSIPFLSVILLPALVFDLARQQGWNRTWRAAVFTLAIFAVYTPYVNFLQNGIYLGWLDVALGLPLAFAVSWLIQGVASQEPIHYSRPSRAVAVAICLFVFSVSPTIAHDPGQGDDAAMVQLTAVVSEGSTAHVEAVLPVEAGCAAFSPVHLVARRAGVMLSSPLIALDTCRFTGTIYLPERGRWFVYVELVQDMGSTVEAWLPVTTGSGFDTFERKTNLYVPSDLQRPALQLVAGVLLYAFNLGVVFAVILLFRRQRAKIEVTRCQPPANPLDIQWVGRYGKG
jgi:hypothetical protein